MAIRQKISEPVRFSQNGKVAMKAVADEGYHTNGDS
jgi:hypothetical protein